MKKALQIFLAIAILFLPTTTMASGKSMKEQSVSIEVGNDFYSAGGLVGLQGPVDDDAYLAGAVVNVDKKITNDLVAAGSALTITSEIGDDLRAAGSVVTLTSVVGGDAILAGGILNLSSDSSIAGDARLAGGILNFGGSVGGDLQLVGDEIIFGGLVAGDVEIRIGKKIDFVEGAKIDGKLTYFSKKEIEIPEGVASSVERKDSSKMDLQSGVFSPKRFDIAGKLFFLLISFVTGAVLLVLCGKSSEVFADTIRQKFWWSLLVGVLALFIPLLVLLLVITMVGAWLAGMLLVAWILALAAAGALMGFLLGSLILRQKKDEKYSRKLLALAIGSVAISAIGFLPGFGGLFIFTVFVLTLGALVLSKIQFYKSAKEARIL